MPEWFPFIVDAWLTSASVRAMSGDEVRVYLALLGHSWKKSGIERSMIDERNVIAGICGVTPRKFVSAWGGRVSQQFVLSETGRYVNPKLESVRSSFAQFVSQSQPVQQQSTETTGLGQQTAFELTHPPALAKPKASKDVASLIEHYYLRWVEVHRPSDGRPPRLSRADRGQAATLCREYGLKRAIEFVDRYLRDGDTWYAEQGHPLSLILRKVNAYRAAESQTEERGYKNFNGPREHVEETKDVDL